MINISYHVSYCSCNQGSTVLQNLWLNIFISYTGACDIQEVRKNPKKMPSKTGKNTYLELFDWGTLNISTL